MMTEKPDASEIRSFLGELKSKHWLDDDHRSRPNYLFHVTDVHNAVSILEVGALLSRHEAMRRNAMTNDNASAEIIEQTSNEVLQCARLYFRPRVPTSFRNEGIRPIAERTGAHCPVPITLVFDAASVLCRRETRFSDGSLARGRQARIGSDAAFLRTIPFEDVYHDTWIPDVDRDRIRFHRHAEVIVPDELPLEPHLIAVRTRSTAELEMLLHLLSDRSVDSLDTYWLLIGLNTLLPLFYKRWAFVQRVTTDRTDVRIEFNVSSETKALFRAVIEMWDASTRRLLIRWEDEVFHARTPLTILRPNSIRDGDILLRLSLDDCLVYENVPAARSDDLIVPA